MIDKITAKIRRYPFQTGIAAGILICLICAGFFSLFQDHGKTLAGNDEIIQQDYLRMTISEYGRNNDELLADWRYKHLGRKSAETLKLMAVDESIPAQQVVSFAKAIGQADKLGGTNDSNAAAAGTPANPRKGLSGFGKVLLILLGLLIVSAGVLYAASLIKTKNKQKRRSEVSPTLDDEPINMITPEKAQSQQKAEPDTLFDLDSLFPQGGEPASAEDEQQDLKDKDDELTNGEDSDVEFDSSGILFQELNIGADNDENQEKQQTEEESAAEITAEENDLPDENAEDRSGLAAEPKEAGDDLIEEDETEESFDSEIIQPGLDFGNSVHLIDEADQESGSEDDASDDDEPEAADQNDSTEISADDTEEKAPLEETNNSDASEGPNETTADEALDTDAEKPLIETDPGSDTENEDELLKLIRGSTSAQNEDNLPEVSEKAAAPEEPEQDITDEPETAAPDEDEAEVQEKDDKAQGSSDDILIHYQSVYRIGNDMYDEVFSIDQGDNFRGECGISIGETLNNTEPKAVTAFEVWLFDKDDIHTATWYLMSDFALDNEGICKRLEQRGKCDRIRKHDVYVLETETLIVEIKVLELEYGTEMEEKNSYFTNVVFDVIARQKPANENAN